MSGLDANLFVCVYVHDNINEHMIISVLFLISTSIVYRVLDLDKNNFGQVLSHTNVTAYHCCLAL